MDSGQVIKYKGFMIEETPDPYSEDPLFVIYTEEEWEYGEGFRTSEWEAQSIQEAHDFIDSYGEEG